jgi:phosphoglycerate dehydrogenase-like enzyme
MRIGLQLTQNLDKYQFLLEKIKSQITNSDGVEFIHIIDDDHLETQISRLAVLACYRLKESSFSLRSNSLNWIHFGVAGVEKSLFPDLINSEVTITNARGIHGGPVSEFIIGMMLYLAKRYRDCEKFKSSGEWKQWEIAEQTIQLAGKTLGIIGYGSIGKALAIKAKAFGMHVIASSRTGLQNDDSDSTELIQGKNIPDLLRRCDFVTITCPLTDETEGMINSSSFEQMKTSAFLLNVSRGKIVNEVALIRALSTGKIAGAALDVFSEEPLLTDNPLRQFENVFLSPHISGNFPEYQEEVAIQFGKNLDNYLNRNSLINVVSKEHRY